MFQIIDNIEVPVTAATRNRPRGVFAQTLDSLEVGQGFIFDSDKPLKTHYPKVSPSKFPDASAPGQLKKFKLWIAGEDKVGVKRLDNVQDTPDADSNDANENGAE